MAKTVVPKMALQVIGRAIRNLGGAGVSQDSLLARFWIYARSLRIADGPGEVHPGSVAKIEIRGRERSRSD